MKYGMIKVTACTPPLKALDIDYNTSNILSAVTEAHANGSQLLILPELSLTGVGGGTLLYSRATTEKAEKNLLKIAESTKTRDIIVVAGLPMRIDDRPCNACAVMAEGKVLGIVPKNVTVRETETISVGNFAVPYGNIVFKNSFDSCFNFGIIIGEELLTNPVRVEQLKQNGAGIILNPTAAISKLSDEMRFSAFKGLSLYTRTAIISVSAGFGETVSDGIYSGEKFIIENGVMLSSGSGTSVTNDIDAELIGGLRQKTDALPLPRLPVSMIKAGETPLTLSRIIQKLPYVPATEEQFFKAVDILATGVYSRMNTVKATHAVLGVSGGSDSTCALIILDSMCKKYNLPKHTILGVIMPGFGSSARTQTNAKKLLSAIGAECLEIPITAATKQHLSDIGNSDLTNITAENAQARERAQILLDVANEHNGLVIGTGDMSEIALGWTTYGGDQLCHYNPNAGLPKTFVRALLRAVSFYSKNKSLASVVSDVLNTPVSPELLKGQVTENIIGPYELHDFFIYNMLGLGFSPKKVLFLAQNAFDNYAAATIKKHLKNFISRFFTNRFKRNASADGPSVLDYDLSSIVLESDISPETYLSLL